MTADDVRAALQRACDKEGAATWARDNDLSRSYVSEVLNGHQEPGDAILKALGLERVVTYRKIK